MKLQTFVYTFLLSIDSLSGPLAFANPGDLLDGRTTPPTGVRADAVKLAPTDAYSDTYRNPDGFYTAVISAKPIRQSTEQAWQDLSSEMEVTDEPGYAAQTQGPVQTSLGGTAASWHRVSRNGHSVAFALQGVSPSPGQSVAASTRTDAASSDGHSATYTDPLPATDLRLTPRPERGVEEDLLLKFRQAVLRNGEFNYCLQVGGLDLQTVVTKQGIKSSSLIKKIEEVS